MGETAGRLSPAGAGFRQAEEVTLDTKDGERVIAERMTLNGQTIDPTASYRVTVNNFLSVGGDGFTVIGPVQRSMPSTW